jgi:hypothetical protein
MPSVQNVMQTEQHELSHGIMNMAGQKQNAGYGVFPHNDAKHMAGLEISNNLRDPNFMSQFAGTTADSIKDPTTLAGTLRRAMIQLNAKGSKNGLGGWTSDTGEYLADLAAERDMARIYGKSELPTSPSRFGSTPTGALVPSSVSGSGSIALEQLQRDNKLHDPTEGMLQFLQVLRQRNAL